MARAIPRRRLILSVGLLLGSLLSGLSGLAGAQCPRGLDVSPISPPAPTSDPDRIVVTEFFSYQCPHCNSFNPTLSRWVEQLPDDVAFRRVPVALGRSAWAPVARTFYALAAIGSLDSVDTAIFRAIHEERQRLYDKESIAVWLGRHGVDRQVFSDAYDSFSVHVSMRRAEQMSNGNHVYSIPSLSIDGKYLVVISDDGTFDRQLGGVDELIARVREERFQPRGH